MIIIPKEEQKIRANDGRVFGWIIDDFVTKEVCQQLIKLGKPKLKPSTTLSPIVEDYRTSSSTFLYYNRGSSAVDQVANLITQQIQMPLNNCEGLQIVHYNPGEYYKPHHDYFHPDADYWDKEIARGGQRVWTAFLYLNDVQEGGTTYFPHINLEVKPKTGRVVFWRNMFYGGELVVDSYHEAKPPIKSEKWGANLWVRQKTFV